jgi:uncharacterized membrane protein YeaQ/YmgE (transglycosylase-associated protein family)
MGLVMWVLAGVAAAATARLATPGKKQGWLPEGLAAVATACVFGAVATLLDFGGWKEPDWRAGLFALAGAALVIALIRIRTIMAGSAA